MRRRNIALVLATSTILGLLVGGFEQSALAQNTLSGKEIMDKVAATRKLDGSEAVVKMTILNSSGQKRVRKIAMATKLYDGGKTEKRIYRFLTPADVKGTGVLTFDYETKSDDMWIYLPALRKTRRIVSSNKSKAFMGSEFSYADMNIPKLDNYNYKVLKEEKVDGTNCYVVETLPKNEDVADEEKYSKKIIWVATQDFTIRKAVYYDLDGELLKELASKNIKLIDSTKKRYRSMYMEMTNRQNDRRSIFEVEKVELNPNVKDEYFTTTYLERP